MVSILVTTQRAHIGISLFYESRRLYRLRIPDLDTLVFLGQGKLADRLKRLPLGDQVECSWVSNSRWYAHQRLELVTDLIGAHLLTTATIPLWQFEPGYGPDGETPRQKAS